MTKIKTRLRKNEVAEIMGWSKSTLNQRVVDGEFIKPTYEGRTPYWLSSEVENHIEKFFAVPGQKSDQAQELAAQN